jgi:hypothetical protein
MLEAVMAPDPIDTFTNPATQDPSEILPDRDPFASVPQGPDDVLEPAVPSPNVLDKDCFLIQNRKDGRDRWSIVMWDSSTRTIGSPLWQFSPQTREQAHALATAMNRLSSEEYAPLLEPYRAY